jgi:long-chain acyl-CoA synthetase
MTDTDLTLSEKLYDYYDKARTIASVALHVLPYGKFSFGTETVRGVPLRVFKTLPPALGTYYATFFEQHRDKEWLVYEEDRLTFGQVQSQYEAVGAELFENPVFNVRPGDRVGICMRNYPELLVSFLAITAAGGVAIPLNAMWGTEELHYAIKDADCSVLIGDPERLNLCQPFLTQLGLKTILVRSRQVNVVVTARVDALWEDVLVAGAARVRAAPENVVARTSQISADDEAMIMYTSGSTGFPKGVVHTQRSVGTAMKIGELQSIAMPSVDPVALMAVPLFHITALCPVGLMSIPQGSKIIMMRKWDAGKGLKVIEEESVTNFTGVPTMMIDLMKHPDFDPAKLSSLKNVMAGGAPVPPSQVSAMRKKSKKISSGQGYGLTETMALGTVNRGADYISHPTSCGKPIPLMVDIAIIDPATKQKVLDGERGEVCIKGAMIMKGYNNLPQKTEEAIDENGYFHSGDIGKMEGGFVYILDRMKDLIIRGGENIDCSEVEAAIVSHPAVRECSVFGLPDERLGEVVGAAIWITDETVTGEELNAYAGKALAKFKVPLPVNIFLHRNELPKGATGKLDKKGMRETYGKVVEQRPKRSRL